jgi:hypothetical protein
MMKARELLSYGSAWCLVLFLPSSSSSFVSEFKQRKGSAGFFLFAAVELNGPREERPQAW